MLLYNRQQRGDILARTTNNPHDEQVKTLIPKEDKAAFLKKCQENDTTISIQLRKFIKEYIRDKNETAGK